MFEEPVFGVKYGFHLSCIGDVFEMKMSYIGVFMELKFDIPYKRKFCRSCIGDIFEM